MSIGNLKDQGNKGNNFPYQLKNLQLLGAINEGIIDLNTAIVPETVGPMANDAFGRLRVSSPLTLLILLIDTEIMDYGLQLLLVVVLRFLVLMKDW